MNLSIQDLPANVIANYEASARTLGITLDEFLREQLIKNAPEPSAVLMSPDEWDKALDECFDSFPATDPLPDTAFDRENIYSREDNWSFCSQFTT